MSCVENILLWSPAKGFGKDPCPKPTAGDQSTMSSTQDDCFATSPVNMPIWYVRGGKQHSGSKMGDMIYILLDCEVDLPDF